ncbi:MAG: acyl-CoA dehydrogenase family protein [Xanthobacteraceae bacterium]|nr:acyl-CoA dehydrogenase family protein [Xanthobacteraceae bacterium]
MNLDFDDSDKAFREEVLGFLRTSLPEEIRDKMMRSAHPEKSDIIRWQRILNAKGWAVPHWPVEWGGTNWTPVQRYIFTEEVTQWPAPETLSFNTTMVGPVLYTFGSEEQKRRFLPAAANLDIWFCQGFSEPGAGSDLASLSTRATREGDDYVINGQKIWTSTAHHADWIFVLARTSPTAKKQEGISFILVDLKTPGVEVRPILTIDGHHYTNEVFFTNVRVPVANLVGEENRGWDYAKFLLGNERVGIARVGLSKARLREASMLAQRQLTRSGSLWTDRDFRQQFARLEIELKAVEMTAMRLLDSDKHREKGKPNPMSSVLKIKGAETQQRSAELLLKAAGPHAIPARWEGNGAADAVETLNGWAEGKASTFFFSRAASIFGGSNEIQRNILAKAVLGL